ncbi:MAG: hypothetical protein WCK89_14225 [bacterium]
MSNRLRIICLCLQGFCCAGVQAAAGKDGAAVQQERLAKHSFVRTEYDPGAIGLLIGNAELGGLATPSGLIIPKLWGADLWKDESTRMAVEGPALSCDEFDGSRKPTVYRQELGLADGVIRTRVMFDQGNGYEAELFCSMANKHLTGLRVKNLGGAGERAWRITRPAAGYAVTNPAPGVIMGESATKGFTREAWAVRVGKAWKTDANGRDIVKLAPGETVTLVYSWTTHWDGADYVQLCRKTVAEKALDFDSLTAAHRKAWSTLWQQSASLAIPDAAMEQIWYRSLFWTLCTCGSTHFLPGESMFVVDCWSMHPFTYGAAGWAVQALTSAGFSELARNMLDWHFKPDALRQNSEFYTRRLAGKTADPASLAFAHEVKTDGTRFPCEPWELQRHLDGFGASLFYRFNRTYPDAKYYRDTVYPVLRGTAEFWKGLAGRDEKTGEFILPSMTSLTEDLIARNPIDAALAAKWCLLQASRTAQDLNLDAGLRRDWKELAGKLCLPQNKERYLEYFGDEEKRAGGGYQGVRGFVYLSYPTVELIPLVDRNKAIRTLEYTWDRNKQGEGMIGFVANWFALADTHYGRGEHALSIMRHNLKCLDKWGTSLSETPGNGNYYFATGYASYILVPLSMAVQSFDDRIAAFPAVPADWKEFAFYNAPVEAGLRVSGEMKDGKVLWVSYRKDNKELLRLDRKAAVAIRHEGRAIGLKVEP